MDRVYILNPLRMTSKQDMHAYMDELFGFKEELDAVNLDALYDSLSEVSEDTDLILTPKSVTRICRSEYAYRLLLVLGEAAQENPHIRLLFREEEE